MLDLFRQHDPDPILTLDELEVMRASMVEKRTLLAKALGEATGSKEFDYLAGQSGMFSLLRLSHAEIDAARLQHGVYIVHDGRINIAGLPLAHPGFRERDLGDPEARCRGKSIGCVGRYWLFMRTFADQPDILF
jgi:Aminotransferase class I and II